MAGESLSRMKDRSPPADYTGVKLLELLPSVIIWCPDNVSRTESHQSPSMFLTTKFPATNWYHFGKENLKISIKSSHFLSNRTFYVSIGTSLQFLAWKDYKLMLRYVSAL